MSTRQERRTVSKTASYTINTHVDRCGTTFNNRGAVGAVTFTLPRPGSAIKGWFYDFLVVADQNVLVATPTADTALVFNDAAADSLAVLTAGQKIGARMRAECDGTAWAIVGIAVGHTYTPAT